MLCRALSTAEPWAGVTPWALLRSLVSPGLLYVPLLCLQRRTERQEGKWLSGMFLFPLSPFPSPIPWMSKFVEQQPNTASERLPAGDWILLRGCKMDDQKQINCATCWTCIKFRKLPSHRFCCVSNKDQHVLQHLWDLIVKFMCFHQLGSHPWENLPLGVF